MTKRRSIFLSFLLVLPVLAFVIHHYLCHDPQTKPTGFTNNENVLYMSYAHQYLDQEKTSLFYSNPFDGDPASPKIYIQPINFLFAGLMKMGIDPGLIFSLFGLIMAFCCIYLGVQIIRLLIPDSKYQTLVAVLFTWGGGFTALAGIAASLVSGGNAWPDGIYAADPANGWWGLNWGRVLFIPLEAYYHFLFLLCVYFVLLKKWKGAALVAFFLSLSHPFTGIEYLSITTGWLLLEKIVYRNRSIPWWFVVANAAIIVFHGWYYLVYLPGFAAHRQLFDQYSAGWTYSFRIFMPAYLFVFGLCLLTARLKGSVKMLLNEPHQRLFLCWAVIAFLLSKHEWFMKPMQPIHFTRGYVWAGLFLFSIPGIIWLTQKFRSKTVLWMAFLTLFFLDNALWIGDQLRQKEKSEWEGYLKNDTREVFTFLHDASTPNDLLLGEVSLVNYMANVYSPANAWVSHFYNTPQRMQRIETMREFFSTGVRPAIWSGRRLLIIVNKQQAGPSLQSSLMGNKVFENATYVIYSN